MAMDFTKAVQSISARLDDLAAIRRGCSEYERSLRGRYPHNTHCAEARDLSIRLDVLLHERRGWWQR